MTARRARRFVLFGAARSGTTLVVSTLNLHPEIVCHGEIFHETAPQRHLVAGLSEADFSTIDRFSDRYLEMAFSAGEAEGAAAVGFKMWRQQAPERASQLLADESVDKIIMERTNLLALYSSVMLARKTRVWNVAAGEAPPKRMAGARIAFDRDEFDAMAADRTALFDGYRAEARGRVLGITYDGVVARGFSEALAFLGVSDVPLAPAETKLHSSDILERFTPGTRAAALRAIEAHGHPEWAREGAA